MKRKYNSIGEEYELHGMFFGFILGLVVAVAMRSEPTQIYTAEQQLAIYEVLNAPK